VLVLVLDSSITSTITIRMMKKYPAIAVVEFRDIAAGMHATDAMLKKAPIMFVRAGTISGGRYMTLIGGTTASVDESFNEGLFHGAQSVIDHVFLADVHPHLHDAILGHRRTGGSGAMAIVETPTVSANVRSAELALKGTPVSLVEIRLADQGLAGKGLSIYQGELHDVEAAIDIVLSHLVRTRSDVMYKIISSPHEAMTLEVDAGTMFSDTKSMELDGERI
jgi:microcompartment protein CcmL/EutN